MGPWACAEFENKSAMRAMTRERISEAPNKKIKNEFLEYVEAY
jgi:hypothetical protein